MSEIEDQGQVSEDLDPNLDLSPEPVDEIQQEINRHLHDQKGAYWDENHPGHQAAVAEVQRLYRQQHAEEEGASASEHIMEDNLPTKEEGPPPIPGIELPPMPDGQEWDTESLQSFVPIAKEMGLSEAEIQVELQGFTAGATSFDPVEYDEDAGIEALNQRWGDSAAQVVAQAQEFINSLPAGTRAKLVTWLESTGYGNHPRVVEALSRRQAAKEGQDD